MITEDMHVHSTFSDGANTIEENVQRAVAMGLKRICCVDHVRVGTTWVPEMVAEVKRLRLEYPIEILCAVEAKFLDANGRLDCPANLPSGVDHIYAADHQVPLGDACYKPGEVIDAMATMTISKDQVLAQLVKATVSAMRNYDNVVIAHLFSILPKIGIGENEVSLALLEQIAEAAVETNTPIEIDERWKCPGLRSVVLLKSMGVDIWFSTDSHKVSDIGKYSYASKIYRAVAA